MASYKGTNEWRYKYQLYFAAMLCILDTGHSRHVILLVILVAPTLLQPSKYWEARWVHVEEFLFGTRQTSCATIKWHQAVTMLPILHSPRWNVHFRSIADNILSFQILPFMKLYAVIYNMIGVKKFERTLVSKLIIKGTVLGVDRVSTPFFVTSRWSPKKPFKDLFCISSK